MVGLVNERNFLAFCSGKVISTACASCYSNTLPVDVAWARLAFGEQFGPGCALGCFVAACFCVLCLCLCHVVRHVSADRRVDVTQHDVGGVAAVASIMTPLKGLLHVSLTDSASHVIEVFFRNNVRHLPVIDSKEHLVGIISMRDMLRPLMTGSA